MKKKDQEAIAKLYLENSDMSEFETGAPFRPDNVANDRNDSQSDRIHQIVFAIFEALEQYKNLEVYTIAGMIKDLTDPNNIEDVKYAVREVTTTTNYSGDYE
jgi:hypothetical protein